MQGTTVDGKLNHVAIAVTNLDEAAEVYRALGAVVSEPRDRPITASRSSLSNCRTPRSNCCV